MAINNRKLAIILTAAAVGMFGFGYALVPIYSTMCKAWGINGKPSNMMQGLNNKVDYSRVVTVQFLATRNNYLPWKFQPLVKTIKVHPGENTRVAFYAQNETGQDMIVQAIPSVTPGIAAKYLKKTECFCFTKQMMKGKQGMEWPLLFHLDADLPKNIRTVTLSYTLFDITKTAQNFKPTQPAGKIPG
jgi:cytochrome c oxidase assembly protein subunit 11